MFNHFTSKAEFSIEEKCYNILANEYSRILILRVYYISIFFKYFS